MAKGGFASEKAGRAAGGTAGGGTAGDAGGGSRQPTVARLKDAAARALGGIAPARVRLSRGAVLVGTRERERVGISKP